MGHCWIDRKNSDISQVYFKRPINKNAREAFVISFRAWDLKEAEAFIKFLKSKGIESFWDKYSNILEIYSD